MEINVKATNSLFQLIKNKAKINAYTFEDTRKIVPFLGAHYSNDSTQFGFWLPELLEKNITTDRVFLEILSPKSLIDFSKKEQNITFDKHNFPMNFMGELAFLVVDGVKAGTANRTGDFYCVKYIDENGAIHRVFDPLSYSIPFGAFAPAEVYDMESMLKNRQDKAHFEQLKELDRFPTPVHILQLHPHTATKSGSLQGLSEHFQTISKKIENNESLTKSEKAFANYDAVQLLPVMPQIDRENALPFFDFQQETDQNATIQLTQHNIQDWGYDIVIAAASAINPSLLATKRPHELLNLIEVLHNFQPQPKKVILDIVYGHSDNQAQLILNRHFFLGAGMYGQEMNVQHPMVRAIMLESQLRIGNYGVDGFRVDAAQDIVYHDENGKKQYDNAYLGLMNEMTYRAADVDYKMWMVFEDGRPWPQPDWNIATTYKVVHNMYPNAFQWGPLTFVNNKPLIFGFWMERFWRVEQIARTGQMWVTGGSNHDTYRGLAQLSPTETNYNSYLGDSLRAVAFKAYNNPAARLLDHAFLPGIPMEFINASTDAPWGFLRNTDFQWGIKVMSEEQYFFDWFVTDDLYKNEAFFTRLKSFGFHKLPQLIAFKNALHYLVKLTDYDLEKIIRGFEWFDNQFTTPKSVKKLRSIALAYMEDAYDFCNVSHHIENTSETMIDFNYSLRDFRTAQPILIQNLTKNDVFKYWHSPNGAVIYYGLRTINDQQILVIANMEVATTEVPLSALDLPNFDKNNWELALKTPDCTIENIEKIVLKDSEGVLFSKK